MIRILSANKEFKWAKILCDTDEEYNTLMQLFNSGKIIQ